MALDFDMMRILSRLISVSNPIRPVIVDDDFFPASRLKDDFSVTVFGRDSAVDARIATI
jgi:hypothetical protein